MPLLTTTIEDNSPLINYSPDWQAGSSGDRLLDSYSASAFTLTSKSGASASFTFNGTGVTLYGAKRLNHDTYRVRIDDETYPTQNGSVPDPGIFQTSLFSETNLKQGQHTLVIEYTGPDGSYFDLDFITWQGDVGETEGGQLYVNTFQDSDPAFVYDSSWSDNTSNANPGTYSGGRGHIATKPGAKATFTFKGDGVSLYGPVSPSGAPFTVQIDTHQPQSFTSNRAHFTPQVLLYQATKLGPGEHQVNVAVAASATSSQYLAIDYANVYTTYGPNGTNSGTNGTSTSGGGSSNGLSAGPIVGIAIGSFAAGAIFIGALMFLFFRRRDRQAQGAVDEKLQPTPFNASTQPVLPAQVPAPTSPTASSDPNIQYDPYTTYTTPFMAGGEMRKGQHPSSSSLPDSRFASTHTRAGSTSMSVAGTSDGPARSTGVTPAAGRSSTAARAGDEVFPPDYAQAMGSLRDR